MEVIETRIPWKSRSDVFKFWYLTDIHAGSAHCDEELLKETVKKIEKDPHSFWWLGGDACEFISMRDLKRFEPGSLASWISMADLADIAGCQATWLTNTLKPIAKKCLGVGKGNHDETWHKRMEQDVHVLILGKMNAFLPPGMPRIRSIGYSGFHVLKFSRGEETVDHTETLTCYLHHGYFGGRLKGNKANKLKEILQGYTCDVVLTGHNHDRLGFPDIRMRAVTGPNGPRIEQENVALINCGAFLKTIGDPGLSTPYTETKGYLPTKPGPIPFTYCPNTRTIEVLQ